MAFTATDWSIDRQTGDIRYIGDDHGGASPSYATVIQFHRALQDFSDDEGYGNNDELDITDTTPSERSTDNIVTLINGWNIDDGAAEHLYDGSVVQGTAGAVVYDGLKILAPSGTNAQIIQNGAVLADDWWNSGAGLNADPANGVSHNFMLKVRGGAADIDGRRLIATCREWGNTYNEFKVNGTTRGINVVALATASDLNNQTAIGTIAALADISNLTEGYALIDANANGSNETYYSKWDKGANTINIFYERMKWLTRDASTSTLYGLNGELFRGITHEITVDNPITVTDFSAFEPVTWSGGTGQMLAINDVNAPTKIWIQLLTGVAPTDGQTITGTTSSATADVNVTVTERSISSPFCGASTGSAIIGSYGFGIEAADLSATDKVFDLTNTQITPPNNVTFTVSGLVSGDRVLVTNDETSNIDYNQLTLNGALIGAAVTSVVVNGAIPSDTPSSGTIRILRADGQYTRHPFSAWTGSTFTITSHDFSTNNAANAANTFISYIDNASGGTSMNFSCVFSSTRTLFIRVRDGGGTPIKTFETTGTLSSSGGSTTAIRTSDS